MSSDRSGATEPALGPIIAPPGASPALASRPDGALVDERFLHYEENPVPWWITTLWLGFFTFAALYLMWSFGMWG